MTNDEAKHIAVDIESFIKNSRCGAENVEHTATRLGYTFEDVTDPLVVERTKDLGVNAADVDHEDQDVFLIDPRGITGILRDDYFVTERAFENYTWLS